MGAWRGERAEEGGLPPYTTEECAGDTRGERRDDSGKGIKSQMGWEEMKNASGNLSYQKLEIILWL